MKVAIITDWIVDIGGAEKVLKSVCDIYKDADIFTLFYRKKSIESLKLPYPYSTALQRLPFIDKIYRNLLPLFPYFIEQIDVSSYDLIISLSHSVAKSVITNHNQTHICYIYTPMRYLYDLYFEYLKDHNLHRGLKSFLIRYMLHRIRLWDYTTKDRPDHYIACSKYVANRVKKIYGKECDIIYPPVDIENITFETKKEDYYITVSRLVPYKKIDVIVEAFNMMPDKKLVVIGDGPQMRKIKAIAGKNIEITGFLPSKDVVRYVSKAKAFVFAALEDFGIAPIEAQASGTPVIAYAKGGSLETVVENKTGLFFYNQTPEDILDAVKRFEKIQKNFDPHLIRKNSERFSSHIFKEKFKSLIETKTSEKIL